jgi:hypothetical protein
MGRKRGDFFPSVFDFLGKRMIFLGKEIVFKLDKIKWVRAGNFVSGMCREMGKNGILAICHIFCSLYSFLEYECKYREIFLKSK